MSQTTNEMKSEVKKTIGLFYTLRDEIKLKLHLAGMDAKDEWNKVEPQVTQLEGKLNEAAEDVNEATREAVDDVVKRLQKIRASLS
jgi:flagellar biosynthesis chaperone FliJ